VQVVLDRDRNVTVYILTNCVAPDPQLPAGTKRCEPDSPDDRGP